MHSLVALDALAAEIYKYLGLFFLNMSLFTFSSFLIAVKVLSLLKIFWSSSLRSKNYTINSKIVS